MSQAMSAYSEECYRNQAIVGRAAAESLAQSKPTAKRPAGRLDTSTSKEANVVHGRFANTDSSSSPKPETKLESKVEPTTKASDEDIALVKRVQAGDGRAFDLLVGKYQTGIARVVSQYLKDQDVVKDVVQEAFIRAYKGLANFRYESQFYTWLYRIAVNTAYNHMRSVQRWQGMLDIDDEYHESEVAEHTGVEGPEHARHNEDLKQAIQRAVARLPMDLRTALLLREMEDMSYEQIAEVVGCKVGTVKSRISRAREQVMQRTESLYRREQSQYGMA